jgi:hypothetical protein
MTRNIEEAEQEGLTALETGVAIRCDVGARAVVSRVRSSESLLDMNPNEQSARAFQQDARHGLLEGGAHCRFLICTVKSCAS